MSDIVPRVAYGLLFILGVPALLAWWAHATAGVVPLPAVHAPMAGIVLVAAGIALMSAGMSTLVVRGGGLPMNAFPPPHYVDGGVFGWLAHPIYVGFLGAVLGVALAAGSASGVWLVTPVTALCTLALVLGYENPALRRRFTTVQRPRLSLPPADGLSPTVLERAAVIMLVLVPWLLSYQAVHMLGIPPDAVDARLPFERGWPVWQWTELIYLTAYVVVPGAALLAPTRASLRRFAVLGLLATGTVTLVYVTVPLISPPRPFSPSSPWGQLLAREQQLSSTVAAFPAFHVIWACIAADALRARGRRTALLASGWVVLLAASCITTGMHALIDVAAAFLCFALLARYDRCWHWLRNVTERLANSWHEWRLGPVRIINHGFYAGVGAAVGVWIAALTTGSAAFVLAIAAGALLGAGACAQWLEGSSVLLRPFSYYGAIAGGVLVTLALALAGASPAVLLAGFAVGAPLVQASGRIRCLVQGCCHGAPAPATMGIRYCHPRSRVTQLAQLRGVPLYPTQLYSIASNIVAGMLLLRLYFLDASPTLILGLYFILNGSARFVEESYRGEPQTPVLAGLRVYQWLAIASVIGGILVTTLTPLPWPRPLDVGAPFPAIAALVFGSAVSLAMGVDFPASSRRFSRLADAVDVG
ncbi:MAG TPA: prolipoprotein diacylglyceryl transferase family protein [Longimicrobiales bacterium]|nr:prolipoprotein diacylglyceryl transferase family protein [Longimicrobiales bacterium]